MPNTDSIILTGFEPFAKYEINPSGEIAKRLNGEAIEGKKVEGIVLPVSSNTMTEILTKKISDLSPSVVISSGLAAKRIELSLERIAINWKEFIFPDNAGNEFEGENIDNSGPAAYFTNLDLKRTIERLREENIPCHISNCAGTHVCNQIMYETLRYVTSKDLKIKVGFVHLPLIPELALNFKEPVPFVPLDFLTEAMRIIIKESLVEGNNSFFIDY